MQKLTNKKTIANKTFWSALTIGAIIGCSPQNGSNSSSPQPSLNANNQSATNQSLFTQKVYAEEAQVQDIKLAKSDCEPSDDPSPKVCVKICHVPPGNPQNKSEKIISLSALKAHLNHGSVHSDERDFMGACTQEDSSASDPSTNPQDTSSGSSSGGSGDTSTPSTTTDSTSSIPDTGSTTDPTASSPPSTSPVPTTDTTNLVPLWCEPYVAIDSNCDGINDITNEPYL